MKRLRDSYYLILWNCMPHESRYTKEENIKIVNGDTQTLTPNPGVLSYDDPGLFIIAQPLERSFFGRYTGILDASENKDGRP